MNNYPKDNFLYSLSAVVSTVKFSACQISPVCAWSSGNVARVKAEHNGGSRATAAISDRHAGRLAIRAVSDPNDALMFVKGVG